MGYAEGGSAMGYGKRKTHRPLALPVTFARAQLIFRPLPTKNAWNRLKTER